MTQEGLIAPEGIYTPAWNYLLPLAAPVPVPISQTQMQSATVKDASSSNPTSSNVGNQPTSPVATSASGTMTLSSGLAPSPSNGDNVNGRKASDPPLPSSSSSPSFGASNNAVGSESAADRLHSTPKTALSQISLAAPSAWSHAPVQPMTKLSVVSVRYPPTAPTSQRTTGNSGSSGSNNGSGSGSSEGAVNDLSSPMSYQGPLLEGSLASQGIDGSPMFVAGGGQGGVPGVAALQLLSHLSGTPATGVGGAGGAASSMLGPTAAGPSSSSSTSGGGSGFNKNLAKPKNNIKQTSSSFVQRLQNHSDFTKMMGQRSDGNTIERFAFANRQRVLFWLGENANGWIKDPLARLTFASPITSHDINQHTRSPSRLDVIIGFKSGDIIWFEPFSSRYSRINKGGCVHDSPITSIRWLPGTETLFISTHSDGTCTLFDVSRDDATPGSWSMATGVTIEGVSSDSHSSLNGSAGNRSAEEFSKGGEEQQELLSNDGSTSSASKYRFRTLGGRQRQPTSDSMKTTGNSSITDGGGGSVTSTVDIGGSTTLASRPKLVRWDPLLKMVVSRPANDATGGDTYSKKVWMTKNPVAHWQVAKNAEISDIAFSPDSTRLAVVSTDGKLRIIDLLNERLDQTATSYFGTFTCVAWSPDAKLLVTGGSDDLVSVWSPEGRILGRCIGHSSFIKAVAFDPWRWRADDRTYRFASVAEDGKVIMWDFSSAALHRPKMAHGNSSYLRQASKGGNSSATDAPVAQWPGGRMSMSSTTRPRISMSADRPSYSASVGDAERDDGADTKATYHPALMRKEVAELQPVAVLEVSRYPLAPHNIDGVPSTSNAGSLSTGASSTAGMLGVAVPSHLSGNPSTLAQSPHELSGSGGVGGLGHNASSTGSTGASASPMTASISSGAPNGQASQGSGSSGSGIGARNPLAAFGDIGTASDLLVGVRYRPDGLLVLHKSGTMRFLSRPKPQRQASQQQQQQQQQPSNQPVKVPGGSGWRR